MKSLTVKNGISGVLALGLSLGVASFSSCGSSDESIVPPAGGGGNPSTPGLNPNVASITCGSGAIALFGQCFFTTDLQTACSQAGGQITSSNGVTVCRKQATLSGIREEGFSNSFPALNYVRRLTPGSPSSNAAYINGFTVRPGDLVTIKTDAEYGKVYFSGVHFNDCDDVNEWGYINSSTTPHVNEGQDAGMMISDSTKSYYVGGGPTSVNVQNQGLLRVGVNSPSQTGCMMLFEIEELKVSRCEDGTDKTYPCPF